MRIKLVSIALIIAMATMVAIAIESGPSNTVGFIGWDCSAAQWTPFSFPFTYYNTGHILTYDVNDIMHGDFTAGDEIYDQNTMTYITYDGSDWSGAWDEIVPGHAYWAKINGSADVTAITAGEVDVTAQDLGTMEVGWNIIGLREPGVVSLDESGLIQSGFTGGVNPAESDRIYDQNTLSYAWYNTATSNWVGLEDGLQPTHALWIWVHPDHSSFQWIYGPMGNADAATASNPVKSKTIKSGN